MMFHANFSLSMTRQRDACWDVHPRQNTRPYTSHGYHPEIPRIYDQYTIHSYKPLRIGPRPTKTSRITWDGTFRTGPMCRFSPRIHPIASTWSTKSLPATARPKTLCVFQWNSSDIFVRWEINSKQVIHMTYMVSIYIYICIYIYMIHRT